MQFLSTLPARGATSPVLYGLVASSTFLSTLPARGATGRLAHGIQLSRISIHAPREGSDPSNRAMDTGTSNISIHAPREGSDVFEFFKCRAIQDFYPCSPRGERQQTRKGFVAIQKFLSTLPARGAT